MKRSLKQLVTELIQIASELEEFETSLSSFLGGSVSNLNVPLRKAYDSHSGGETIKSAPFVPTEKEPQSKRRFYKVPPKANLTKIQKEQIRLLYSQGGVTIPELVETYHSNVMQINAILKNNITKAVNASIMKRKTQKEDLTVS